MKIYVFNEPCYIKDKLVGNREVHMTEEDVVSYMRTMLSSMASKDEGYQEAINLTDKELIEEFCIVNWAWEKE
jgi:hypothetical protein